MKFTSKIHDKSYAVVAEYVEVCDHMIHHVTYCLYSVLQKMIVIIKYNIVVYAN